MDKNFYNNFHTSFSSLAYQYLGCHLENDKTVFRVYAPHAISVSVVGDFNNWVATANVMEKVTEKGVWEIAIAKLPVFTNYKYSIKTKTKTIIKQDPYAFHSETNLQTCSKVYNVGTYKWSDDEWMKQRSEKPLYNAPLNIYEVHLGSWKRYKDGNYYNYRKIADQLIPYVKKMGYTHIEVMPIYEYPFDGSWGYQVTGYFSVTSRYGVPDDFCYFIEKAHKNGIGVIIDWVPGHFPKDDFGLYEFDGEYLYEDPNPTRMEHRSWGTRIFNYQKPEVKSFLMSSARFLFDIYHADGIRVDAVAAMIYLDYDRDEWIPNHLGGNHNLEAIGFLQDLNKEIFANYPNVLMIAEESTDFAGVTKPTYANGLGFNFKWNMGWMNDTLSYMAINPLFRKFDHHKMTFSIVYAYSENFVLPISHDEVVHGKCSLLNKMPGEYEEKFANLRAYLGYMMTHPGKKLLFMGCEFGQFIEWDYKNELDWLLLAYPAHKSLQKYVSKLNHFYLKNDCLWSNDCSYDGFEWLNADDTNHNVYMYKRYNTKGDSVIVVINMSGAVINDYRLGVDRGTYKEVFNSDLKEFGGSNITNDKQKAQKIECLGKKYSISVTLPKLSILIFKKN